MINPIRVRVTCCEASYTIKLSGDLYANFRHCMCNWQWNSQCRMWKTRSHLFGTVECKFSLSLLSTHSMWSNPTSINLSLQPRKFFFFARFFLNFIFACDVSEILFAFTISSKKNLLMTCCDWLPNEIDYEGSHSLSLSLSLLMWLLSPISNIIVCEDFFLHTFHLLHSI